LRLDTFSCGEGIALDAIKLVIVSYQHISLPSKYLHIIMIIFTFCWWKANRTYIFVEKRTYHLCRNASKCV